MDKIPLLTVLIFFVSSFFVVAIPLLRVTLTFDTRSKPNSQHWSVANSQVEIFHQGAGESFRGRMVDICESRATLKVGRRLEPDSLIFVEARRFGLAGTARVRRCGPQGLSFLADVEFRGPMMKTLKLV